MRIVIAEDLVLLRDGLVRMLSDAGHRIAAQVGDGPGLISAVMEQRPDMVIADVRMPPDYQDEGARAVLAIRERMPDLPVMVLSHVVDPSLAAHFGNHGFASFGYLLKDRILDTSEFLDAVEQVAGGGTVIDPEAINSFLARNSGRLLALTAREHEVLRLLAVGRSNTGIAEELVLSRRTVEAHLRSIFTKLDIESAPTENQRVRAALDWLRVEHPGDAALSRPARWPGAT